MKNYLYDEFTQACSMEGIAPSAWAYKNGLGKSIPTAIKNGIRPETETLQKLCTCWSTENRGIRIIQAYLKDEIERIGLTLDQIQPLVTSESRAPQLDEELKTIGKLAEYVPNLREAIHVIANLLKLTDYGKNIENEPVDMKAVEQGAAAMLMLSKSGSKRPHRKAK